MGFWPSGCFADQHVLISGGTSGIGAAVAKAFLAEKALVTVTGVGGSGKTRLALAVAGELDEIFADGLWVVELASIADPELLPRVVAAAVDEGLAAVFAGASDLGALRALLGIPEEVTPVGVIPIGHPAPDVPSPSLKRGRRPLESVVHWERW